MKEEYRQEGTNRRLCVWVRCDIEIIEKSLGAVTFKVSGVVANETFANESGGHRWQRIPETEKNGRVQTSTITVAVLPDVNEKELELKESDLEWSTSTSQGPGGQGANTTYSCVILKHVPSGMTVRCQNERSQFQNKKYALDVLRSRLIEQEATANHADRAKDRKDQIGSGQRGDKRRTIRVKDGQVKDHITGQTWDYKKYVTGNW
jgi:peptide chain release factor 1